MLLQCLLQTAHFTISHAQKINVHIYFHTSNQCTLHKSLLEEGLLYTEYLTILSTAVDLACNEITV
jgi:hypothetical protein